MEKELSRDSICKDIPYDIKTSRDFRITLERYLEDSTATCEKSDNSITFYFPMEPKDMRDAHCDVLSNVMEISFWSVPGIPGSFTLKAKHKSFKKNNRIFHGATLFGIYCPSDIKKTGYVINTNFYSDKYSWFLEISIGNVSGDFNKKRYEARKSANITIFEDESKTFKELCFDDSRLASLENPLKRETLQELSKKTQEIISTWRKDAVFTLKLQPK